MLRRGSQNESMVMSGTVLARSARNANGTAQKSKRSSIVDVIGIGAADNSKTSAESSKGAKKKSIWSSFFRLPSFKSSKKEEKKRDLSESVEQSTQATTTSAKTSSAQPADETRVLNNDFDRDEILATVGEEEVAEVIIAYADKYTSLAEKIDHSDGLDGLSKQTKLLCGRTVAKMPLATYLTRMVGLLNRIYDKDGERGIHSTGVEIIMVASIYLDRILNDIPEFALCPLNVHRAVFAAVSAAIKFSEDRVPDKNLMATIGGVDAQQASAIESRFCSLINFRFYVSEEDVQRQFDQFCLPLGIEKTVIHGNDY